MPYYLELLPRSDGRPAYTSSEHIEGIQYGHITVRQTEAQFKGVWKDMTLEKTYNRDAKTKLFIDISQQPAAMEKYWRALPILTTESDSEQTKAMTHLDLDDTKYQESVFLFRKLAFSLVNSFLRLAYLERYRAWQTGFFSRKSEWGGGPPHSEGDIVLSVCDSI